MTTGVYIRASSHYGDEAFDSRYEPVPESGCWLWTGYHNGLGYGKLKPIQGDRAVYAHRYSYLRFKGSIPEGTHVCHKCDTPSCVNPTHLFLGSHSDNMQDRLTKGRSNKGVTRLSDSSLLEILTSSLSQRKLAKKYGVSQGMIWKLRAGKIAAAGRVL